MGDVKRYAMDENSLMGGMDMFEDDDGDYVHHSDYAAILARHNALVDAVKKLTAADDDLMDAWDEKRANEMQKAYSKARDEVDRLIANEPEPAE